MLDDPLTECPECGEPSLAKVFGVPAIAFKGSGFYKTDTRGSSAKSASGSSTGTDSGSSGEGNGKASDSDASKGDTKKSESKTESTAAASG